jgi:hypothetical protein
MFHELETFVTLTEHYKRLLLCNECTCALYTIPVTRIDQSFAAISICILVETMKRQVMETSTNGIVE